MRRGLKSRITPEAIAAWQSCDERALACALGLDFFAARRHCHRRSRSLASRRNAHLTRTATARVTGHMEKCSSCSANCWRWQDGPIAAQPISITSPRPRAGETIARCGCAIPMLAKGTGMDEASLKEKLKEDWAEVAYRKKLLAELNKRNSIKRVEHIRVAGVLPMPDARANRLTHRWAPIAVNPCVGAS